MAERQFGPYRLIRRIAVGGMAEIHLAKTKGIAGFEKYVALKMIHPNFAEDEQFIQMLVDEAKIAVQLTHGNIAQTFDLGRVGETYYITMEYVDGADLYKILRRASEQDLEMPLDVCAFVAKEITSALDHAHRKRDHSGKPLGIVHRDVSPQNVLISYSGEVKLVDFGIAKATMKARQTAVGVIKGKYYYMSPEQAWGDPIDYRSDIFSAGIVLYEMITGQMLYLEEDLHKLLDLARQANIPPPSTLRKGIPPQLERIIMHALAKVPGDRYQSAADFATDLERFLHAYSPVFTTSKVAGLIRKVIGDPLQVPDPDKSPSVELRDGSMSTHPLTESDLAHARDKDDLRDENSVLFHPAELDLPAAPPVSRDPSAKARAARSHAPTDGPPIKAAARLPASAAPRAPESPTQPAPVRASKRQLDEETRQLVGVPPPGPGEDTGISPPLPVEHSHLPAWEATATHPGEFDLENVGERTVVGSALGAEAFMLDAVHDEATMITGAPGRPDSDHDSHERADQTPVDHVERHDLADTQVPHEPHDFGDDEIPTVTRAAIRGPRRDQPEPPALAANIHAPAVSELRRPKASRRTPPGGVSTQSNVLQQIVGAQVSEAMPVPRHADPPPALSPQFPVGPPGGPQPMMYDHHASGMPMGTPPQATSHPPGVSPHLQPYLQMQGVPAGYAPQYPQASHGYAQYPQMTPGGLYPSARQAPPMSPGGPRLFETDELPAQYRLGGARRPWLTYIVGGVIAVSVAAIATFLVIRTAREAAPTPGSIHVESVPPGAEVSYDNQRLTGSTPLTIDDVPLGTRHDLKIALPRYKAYIETVDIPKSGGEIKVMALLRPVTGKLVVNSRPGGAEIWINDQLRGRTPTTINDVDMGSAKKLEIRLKDYQPFAQQLTWPESGQIDLDIPLQR
ncbi:MAG: serine/threonine protein kinase [Deltaproteobacteria bacterium]|nr:serine/threonine protein kinase [Deltaproteobacteria bacterium]